MMKPIYLIALLALFSAACTNKAKSSHKNVSGHDTSVKKAEMVLLNKPTLKIKPDTLIIDTTKKLLSYSANELFSDTVFKDHFSIALYGESISKGGIIIAIELFSDTVFKDHFSIALYGESISKGGIIIAIHDHNNKQIYKEESWSTDLLGDSELSNNKQIEDSIKVRMAHFFDKSNFFKPAIAKDEKIEDSFDDPDATDKQNWADIKADPTAISFSYNIGYETTLGIAFSKKTNKMVTIFAQD
ncbi:hypothetical protein [Mucilaginibacter dorajii]|nr:hypothetical protein [Mucilaginibacter dorajii]MCS3735648.1 hypothetical protein [Mucilaginibacter dorajii]